MYNLKSNTRFFFFSLPVFLFGSCQPNQVQTQGGEASPFTSTVISREEENLKLYPTFVLVPGAWHPASCYSQLAFELGKSGYRVKTVELPGLGNDLTPVESVSLMSHVEAVEKVINATEGKVILVGHSYGGILISQVGERMPERIEKLVYLAAFMVESGQSLYDVAIGDTSSLVVQNLLIDGPLALLPSKDYVRAFYHTSLQEASPAIGLAVKDLCAKLRPHPASTLVTPVLLTERYESLPKVYIKTSEDKAISLATQEKMLENHPGTLIFTLESDHSPFVTMPLTLSMMLEKISMQN